MNIKLIQPKEQCDHNLSFIEQILLNRGVAAKDLAHFFELSWDNVQDPLALDNIEKATQMFFKHFKGQSKIAILVDSDCDGFSSSAVLANYIYEQAEHTKLKQNLHFLFHDDKQHGLGNKKIMRQLRDEVQPALLFVPDASGTEEQYKALTDLGIDIIVLDHHETPVINCAKTVIVNNQQSADYVNKDLSGVGVVWQFCRALDMLVFDQVCSDKYLDLVALGLIGDVMNFKSAETRFLIGEGLANINSPFMINIIKAMEFSLKGKLTPTGVAFYLAPLFNAACRIGSLEEKTMLFYSLIEKYATLEVTSGKRGATDKVLLVEEAIRQAVNVKGRQKRRQDKLSENISELIHEERLCTNSTIVVSIDDADEHRVLSGLTANKLQEQYQRPAIILFKDEEKLGEPVTYSGSIRAPENIEAFEDFRQQCVDSNLCIYASGHPLACGVKIEADKIDALKNFFNTKYADVDTGSCHNVDFLIDGTQTFEELADIAFEVDKYKDIWGHGLKEPVIGIKGFRLSAASVKLLSPNKNPTLKIFLGNLVEAMKFRSSMDEYNALRAPYDPDKLEECYVIDLVGKVSINEFRGEYTPQLIIDEYEVTGIDFIL